MTNMKMYKFSRKPEKPNNPINPFHEANKIVASLLETYNLDPSDPDISQNIINATVCIDNAYNGYNDYGIKVGVLKDIGDKEK